MPDNNGTHLRQVTWFWAALWLVAALVIGINGTVVLHQYKVVVAEPTMRLAGMLLIGEVLLYFIVLMLPTERIVPPGRTILAVIGAVGLRAVIAIIAARMAILAGDTTAFDQLWRIMHSSFWLGAMLQMALIAVYLWLIRSALEVPRPRAARYPRAADWADQPEQVRTPTRPSDEQIRQRQEQLLSALMENPEAPVETPIDRDAQSPPLPGVSAEPEPGAAAPTEDHLPAFLRTPTDTVAEPAAPPEPPAQMEMDLTTPQAPGAAESPAEDSPHEEELGEATDSLPPVPGAETAPPSETPEATVAAEQDGPEAAEPVEPSPADELRYAPAVAAPGAPAAEQAAERPTEAPLETPAEDALEPPDRAAAATPAAPPLTPTERLPAPEQATPEMAPSEPAVEPEQAAELAAAPSPEQDFVLRNALNRVVPGQTVETALSSEGRIYALVGLSSEVTAETLTEALDTLLASAHSAAAAMHAGDAQTVLLIAEQATLVTATSADRSSQIVIQSPADTKLGQLTLLGRRAAQVAADVRLGNHCLQADTQLSELRQDPDWAAPTGAQLPQPVAAFAGTAHTVLTTAAGADAPAVAGAAEDFHQAAATVVEALQLGEIDRVLVEGGSAGLVIGPGGADAGTLLAVVAESTAKMGAANVTLTKLRDALRGEA